MGDDVHPFERRGLGVAPFKFVGAAKQGGRCAYCGRVIDYSFRFEDVNGTPFIIGMNCVSKIDVPEVTRDAKHERRRLAREAQAELARAKRADLVNVRAPALVARLEALPEDTLPEGRAFYLKSLREADGRYLENLVDDLERRLGPQSAFT